MIICNDTIWGMDTKRQRGKPKGEPHTVFQFRLLEAQKAAYEAAAKRAGKALAAWIKSVLDRASKR
jgi:hypothetical protein